MPPGFALLTLPQRLVFIGAALLAAAALVFGLLWFGDHHGASRVQAARAKERAELQAQRVEAEAEQRRFKQAQDRNLQEAQDAQARKTSKALADAAGARAAYDRLRQRLAALSAAQAAGGASAAGGSGSSAAAADVLGQCAGELRRVAAAADAMSVQISGLQAWVGAACTTPPE